jgi:cysteinyl-tRNA synthetase
MLLLTKNYREKVDYSNSALKDTAERYSRIKDAAQNANRLWPGQEASPCVKEYAGMFFDALDDDLETGQALSVVENMSEEVLRGLSGKDLSGASRIYGAVESILGIRL